MEQDKSFIVEQSSYTSPVSEEMAKDNVVTFELGSFTGGELHRNSYFKFQRELYHASATHRACVDSICDFIYGKGLAIMGKDGEPVVKGNGNTKIAKLNNLISAKDIKRLIKDRYLNGIGAVQISYKGVGSRRKIAKISHFNIETLCMEKMKDGEVKRVGYHPNWDKYDPRDTIKWFPVFGSQKEDGKILPSASQIEIAIIKPYIPGSYYFTAPHHASGADYMALESEIGEYQINDIQKGFSGTTLINVQRAITNTDKRDYLTQELKDKVQGNMGNKTLVFFNKNKEEQVTLERFPVSDAPSLYEYLAQEASRKILTSHRITNPKILSVPTPGEGGLGNNADEIEVAAEMLQNLVVEPLQMEYLDFISEILDINGFSEELMFVKMPAISEEFYDKKLANQERQMEMASKYETKNTLDTNKPKEKGNLFSNNDVKKGPNGNK